jgi:hypothetical protein
MHLLLVWTCIYTVFSSNHTFWYEQEVSNFLVNRSLYDTIIGLSNKEKLLLIN